MIEEADTVIIEEIMNGKENIKIQTNIDTWSWREGKASIKTRKKV